MRLAHQVDKGHVILRRDQVDIGPVAQELLDGLQDVRVQVHWIDNLYVVPLAQVRQGRADALHAVAEVFTAMACHQDELAVGLQEGKRLCHPGAQVGVFLQALDNGQQGVNDGVAGDVNAVSRNALAEQVVAVPLPWEQSACRRWHSRRGG